MHFPTVHLFARLDVHLFMGTAPEARTDCILIHEFGGIQINMPSSDYS